jgi:hypothetical protein
MKYLGVGLSRTATTSLTSAFQILRYSAWHYCPQYFESFVREEYQSFTVFEQVDVVTDIPAALLYREFKHSFPRMKAILTIRDEEKWYKSVRNHYAFIHDRIHSINLSTRKIEDWLHKFADDLQVIAYGSNKVTRDYIDVYRRHNSAVIDFFDSDDLLVMDITKGDGWVKLCEFIGESEPSVDFPYDNKTWREWRSFL